MNEEYGIMDQMFGYLKARIVVRPSAVSEK